MRLNIQPVTLKQDALRDADVLAREVVSRETERRRLVLRDIDVQIALVLFGYKWVNRQDAGQVGAYLASPSWRPPGMLYRHTPEGNVSTRDVPHYSTDISAAKQVQAYLSERDVRLDIWQKASELWGVSTPCLNSYASTEAEAICLFALKWHNAEPETKGDS